MKSPVLFVAKDINIMMKVFVINAKKTASNVAIMNAPNVFPVFSLI